MKSGIYGIFNKESGKVYVGRGINLESRKRNHWNFLKIGRHQNTPLQRDVILYGIGVFEFKVLGN